MRISVRYYCLYRTLNCAIFFISHTYGVQYKIYPLSFSFDLRCQSGIYIYTISTETFQQFSKKFDNTVECINENKCNIFYITHLTVQYCLYRTLTVCDTRFIRSPFPLI